MEKIKEWELIPEGYELNEEEKEKFHLLPGPNKVFLKKINEIVEWTKGKEE